MYSSKSQNATQTVTGIVIDKTTKGPLAFVNCRLTSKTFSKDVVSDTTGAFTFTEIPIGTITLGISSIGYLPAFLTSIEVTSGKIVALVIELETSVNNIDSIVVGNSKYKSAITSGEMPGAYKIAFPHSNRLAGSISDPARIVAHYPGIATAADMRNDLSIHGASPLGISWVVDDVPIPNPNHFGITGSTGGPVSLLNANCLQSSLFYVSAFPAEFSNALNGVFDLKLRNGSTKQIEYTSQFGFNGAEFGIEGPISKNNASFLFNYRYSTLKLFSLLGINFGTAATPSYQDAVFKVTYPLPKNSGTLTGFGIAGISDISILGKNKSVFDATHNGHNENYFLSTKLAVFGIAHQLPLSKNTTQKFTFALSLNTDQTTIERWLSSEQLKYTYVGRKATEHKALFSYKFSTKWRSKNTLSLTANFTMQQARYLDSVYIPPVYQKLNDFDGTISNVISAAEWKHKFSNKLAITLGLNYQSLFLNNSAALNPKIETKYTLAVGHVLSLAAGMNSQAQPSTLYFYQTTMVDSTVKKTNHDLKLSRNFYSSAKYQLTIKENLIASSELYFKKTLNVPIENVESSYSLLNAGADMDIAFKDSLSSEGIGHTYGLDFTIDKPFSNNNYILVTGSFFNAVFRGSDGQLRNTAFNRKFILNITTGFDTHLPGRRRPKLSFNARFLFAGGHWVTPIDLEKSKIENQAVYIVKDSYTKQLPPYSRLDLKIFRSINRKNVTHQFGIEMLNLLNKKNPWREIYNVNLKQIIRQNQMGILPVLFYKANF